ncbi:RHS repeat-associated core domain-containing protein [Ochrobactrum teleogrylli]|uniref:RHS repeat-associated core domain-containing protein n=1 Tax=Ochrobactrum teleogrylli TaxID=2479765 RepID=A0ABY2Y4N7_9HYPH|nr:RHS repeat-associated core domain-containing protein [[Ochrobactrum] teleogrylli]TNV13865.1 RHS repeat-associated core domain-containing protein [[Ochrobactrum] teleogrylli]
MPDYFTHSINMNDSTKTNVDSRTGLYSVTIPLANLFANKLKGPEQSLVLNYAPFVDLDCGFGRGWQLNWTCYDENSQTLHLPSGEKYKIEVDSGFTIRQTKIKSFNFGKTQDNSYRITHNTGGIEILGSNNNGIWYPTRIFSPLGGYIELSWNQPQSNTTASLASIYGADDEQLLSATYSGGRAAFSLWPDGEDSEKFDIVAVKSNGFLTELQIGDWVWKFDYDRSINAQLGAPLNYVKYPNGMIETVDYLPDAMHYPAEAGHRVSVPCVRTYTRTFNGGQPPVVVVYDFKSEKYNGTNYLGFGGSFSEYNEEDDNIFNIIDSNYRYCTKETLKSDGGDIVTERTFNSFHLMVSQISGKGDSKTAVTVDYWIDGSTFHDLPKYYKCPKSIKVQRSIGIEKGDVYETTFTYNDDGTKKSCTANDGTQIDWEYFDINGETGACPPSPGRLQRFIKTQTVTSPAKTSSTGQIWKSSKYKDEYKYIQLDVGGDINDPNMPVAYAVLGCSQDYSVFDSISGKWKYLYKKGVSYFDEKSDSLLFGRLKCNIKTIVDESGKEYIRNENYKYEYSDYSDTLTTTETITTYDSKDDIVTKSQYSCRTGRVLAEWDRFNVRSDIYYNVHGQVKEVKLASETSKYLRVFNKSYQFLPSDIDKEVLLPTETLTFASGAQIRRWYDGGARQIKEERKVDNVWVTHSEFAYGDHGNIVEITEYDYDGDKNIIKEQTRIDYNNWCKRSRFTNLVNQRFTELDHDLMNRVVTMTWSDDKAPGAVSSRDVSAASVVTQLDARDLPISTTWRNKRNEVIATENSYYDGMKKLREHIDGSGNKTLYDYDRWGRCITRTLPGGDKVTQSYAPQSGDVLITSIAVRDKEIGSQIFDGFGRVTSAKHGGREWSCTYAGSFPKPDTVTAPDGVVFKNEYIPELDCALAKRSTVTGDLIQEYEFDPRLMSMTKAVETVSGRETVIDYEYDIWGNLKKKDYKLPNRNKRTEINTVSAFGRILTHLDVDGGKDTYTYLQDGSVDAVTNGLASVRFGYVKGELSRWTVYEGTAERATTAIERDEFLREISRTVTPTDGDASVRVAQTFEDKSGAIASRSVSRGEKMDWVEEYGYDARNRLTSWSCKRNVQSNDPGAQTFVYDAFDNITSCTTTNYAGKTNVTSYYFDNADDPCQLTRLVTVQPSSKRSTVSLEYDARGCLKKDEKGRRLTYDAMGRLSSINTRKGAKVKTSLYSYDAHGERRMQTLPDKSQLEFYYGSHFPQCVIHRKGAQTRATRWLYHGSDCLVQTSKDGLLLPVSNSQGSILASKNNDEKFKLHLCLPYGQTMGAGADPVTIGFNGEFSDPVSGHYHLGNGYRGYNPVLMRFNAPDSYSPFGPGGINPYAYCSGDPVNKTDPSGHQASTFKIIWGIFSIATFALGLWGMGSAIAGLADLALDEGGILTGEDVAEGVVATTFIGAKKASKLGIGIAGLSGLANLTSTATSIAGAGISVTGNQGSIDFDPAPEDRTDARMDLANRLEIASVSFAFVGGLLSIFGFLHGAFTNLNNVEQDFTNVKAWGKKKLGIKGPSREIQPGSPLAPEPAHRSGGLLSRFREFINSRREPNNTSQPALNDVPESSPVPSRASSHSSIRAVVNSDTSAPPLLTTPQPQLRNRSFQFSHDNVSINGTREHFSYGETTTMNLT